MNAPVIYLVGSNVSLTTKCNTMELVGRDGYSSSSCF